MEEKTEPRNGPAHKCKLDTQQELPLQICGEMRDPPINGSGTSGYSCRKKIGIIDGIGLGCYVLVTCYTAIENTYML